MRFSLKFLRNRWTFRLAAAVLGPLLVFGVLEVVLRLVGFGFPTGLFVETKRGSQVYLAENDKFTWLFFPPPLARGPLPLAVHPQKQEGSYRIFVLGGSVSKGEPDPAFSFSRILEVLLEARFPGRDFEVINLGITAVNSHVVLRIAREIAPLDGDLWILYMGNNEVMGPFGACSIFGAQAPSTSFVKANVAAKSTKLGQLMYLALEALGRKESAAQVWRGMEMFLEETIRKDDPSLKRVYDNFRQNLTSIIDIALESRSRIIVSTLVSNLKDCAPFASLHSPDLTAEEEKEWEELYRDGSRSDAARKFSEAIEFYEKALAMDSGYAELHFRLGRLYEARGQLKEAGRHYVQARDLDAIRFRPDTRINEIVREVASLRGGDDVHLIDAEVLFAMNSPRGITGETFLHEHVHFNFRGNYLLARCLAEKVEELLVDESVKVGNPQWLEAQDCARALARTLWDGYRITNKMLNRLKETLYTRQLNHAERQERLEQRSTKLNQQMQAVGFERLDEIYHYALSKSPDDWILRDQYATFLWGFQKTEEAKAELRKVLQLIPHHVPARYKLGVYLQHEKSYAEAEGFFEEVVRSRPHVFDAHLYLGRALARQGKHEEACKSFARASRIQPDSAQVHTLWAESLKALDRADEAQKHSEEASKLEVDPASGTR